jgi:rubrerythrin
MNEYQYDYDKLLNILYDLVEKETAAEPEIEGDGYYKGELVYDTWICPRCGARYEIDYDVYEYCPKCGQHIEMAILTDQDDSSDE